MPEKRVNFGCLVLARNPSHVFLDLPESTSQMPARSVQPFLHRSLQCLCTSQLVALPTSKLTLSMGIWTSSGPTRVHIPNGISISSAVLATAVLAIVTDRQTDRQTMLLRLSQ